MSTRPVLFRAAAAAGAGALTLVAVSGPAAAATDDDVSVVNTETIQAYTDASGEVESQRIYEQLHFTGTGPASVENPAVLEGLRNLDGFGGFDTKDGEQFVEVEVDGTEDVRTVSDYEGDLPLDIAVSYTLDGKRVEPADLVGATGDLEVEYTVENVTGRIQTVSFDDGTGETATEDVEVSVPMVGSLTTVLPESFRDVASDQANMAGDGRGSTKMSFTMTLVPPVGADTVTFGYSAAITDAVLPRATVTALPVNPMKNPNLKTAGESYAAGAATGSELTDGASTIDSNLLLLRDGSGDLLSGLIQLRDGSAELQDGLQGKAAPGSEKLADGAGRLSDGLQDDAAPGSEKLADGADTLEDGLGKIDDGSGKLADGSGRLADGTGDAAAGGAKLSSGLTRISDGLDKLAAVDGLPAAQDGIKRLRSGVATIKAGIGTADQPETIIGGLTLLEKGINDLKGGTAQLENGLLRLAGPDGLLRAQGGVDQVKGGLENATNPGGSADQLIGGLDKLLLMPECRDSQQCAGTAAALRAGAVDSKAKLTEAAAGLGAVSGGLSTAVAGITGTDGLVDGVLKIRGGLDQLLGGTAKLKGGSEKLKVGLDQLDGGLGDLNVGITKAVGGVFELADGADTAEGGSAELSDGLGQLDAGANELADGAVRLSDGTGEASTGSGVLAAGARKLAEGLLTAATGSGELAAGADELAAGLGDAADGSGKLTDGLETAAGGAPKLVDGAQKLSDKGTSKLVTAGEDTASKYGVMYATLVAGAERADEEEMVVGAPEGAVGLAAYTFEIKGEDGEGSRNLTRGVAALGLLGAAGGTLLLRRRLI